MLLLLSVENVKLVHWNVFQQHIANTIFRENRPAVSEVQGAQTETV